MRYFNYPPSWLATTIITWLAGATPVLMYTPAGDWLPWFQHLSVLILVLLCINESTDAYGYKVRYIMLILLALMIQSIGFTTQSSIYLIYNVKFIGILAFYAPASIAIGTIFLFSFSHFGIHHFYWQDGDQLMNTALFACFQLFAFVVCKRMQKEQEAREELQLAHSQLSATQALLSQTIAKQERLQLARELHDDVGHQITSLIVNLDVARRTAPDPLQQMLDSCYLQAKDTLKGIRDLVSDKRTNDEQLDLKSALVALTSSVPRLSVTLNYQHHPLLEKLSYANCILRCCQEAITNTLKHANADKMVISLSTDNGLILSIADNGITSSTINLGNGLCGLKERVEALDGKLTINSEKGMKLLVEFGD
ncbi:sensor histidine kinase (plasmid) [Pseudoalteromonas sp. T1lg65]|uniref:sensor histidine kinase n=1 Tax=Pseudoalteromonas sp. T1lg65 TaxID=2077101 RepID=UPI003F7A94F8